MKNGTSVVAYKPADVANDRYIQQYGSYNNENLWDGVVAFPGNNITLYTKDMLFLTLLKIIGNNSESMLKREHKFNGTYVQVPAHVFDRVIKDLEAQVLSRMPFTNLNDIRAQFTTKQASSFASQQNEGLQSQYKILVELGFTYQFPPSSLEEEESN